MKYYSEKLNMLFDTEHDLKEKEEEVAKAKADKIIQEQKEKEERANRAKEVEKALNEAADAVEWYINLLSAFCRDYGAYHMSLDEKNLPMTSMAGMLKYFL